MMIISETARSIGHVFGLLAIGKGTIRDQRRKNRKDATEKLLENFKPNTTSIVHWDGKLIPDITGKKHSDRLPVLVSGDRCHQILGLPKFHLLLDVIKLLQLKHL